MPFVKGDNNINRNGRPKNAEKDLLRFALDKEGKRRGVDFWGVVAKKAFTDNNIMVAVLKKFIADNTSPLVDNSIHNHYVVFRNQKAVEEENAGIRARAEVKDTAAELQTR